MAVMISSVVAMLALVSPGVKAHGWIEKPLARQFCHGNQVKWSVSISGGNGAKTAVTGGSPYGGVPGVCGDPFESGKVTSNFAGMPCDPQETYQQGGTISMQIDVSANHGGFWEVSICDSKDLSQACFDRNKLKSVSHNSEQWYIMDRKLDSPTDKRPDSYFVDWKLPPGLACEHCVVQWSWWTAHNCIFDCDKSVCGFYADGKNLVVYPNAGWKMVKCASKYPSPGQKPQIFRNCADIKITGNGQPSLPAIPAPPVNPVPPPPVQNDMIEQPDCNMPRRFLLGRDLLEEEDKPDDISGAGNGMDCSNSKVEEVLVALNKLRKNVKAQPLECSNRAVGVSENFSSIMCEQGKKMKGSLDNCNLANFGQRCLQIVAKGPEDKPLDSIPEADLQALLEPSYAVAGTAHFSCDGITYWTLLLG